MPLTNMLIDSVSASNEEVTKQDPCIQFPWILYLSAFSFNQKGKWEGLGVEEKEGTSTLRRIVAALRRRSCVWRSKERHRPRSSSIRDRVVIPEFDSGKPWAVPSLSGFILPSGLWDPFHLTTYFLLHSSDEYSSPNTK